MQDSLVIGVIGGQWPTNFGLAQAAGRYPGVSVQAMGVDAPVSEAVAGLIVDAPLEHRPVLLQHLTPRWRVPILVESPVARDLDSARAVVGGAGNAEIVAANPLRYALHARRLLEELAQAGDRLEAFFGAWRFRATSNPDHALPQLLDFIQVLDLGEPWRIAAMQRADPAIITITLRYPSDVLGSIEVGSHLPASFPSGSELVVECFTQTRAYSCAPGNQSVVLYGRDHVAHAWQPDPADAAVAEFTAWLSGGPRPSGSLARDVSALRLVDRVGQALQTGGVLEVKAV